MGNCPLVSQVGNSLDMNDSIRWWEVTVGQAVYPAGMAKVSRQNRFSCDAGLVKSHERTDDL